MAHRRIPKMCRHRASGRAVVRLLGKDYYLGKWGTPEAESAYHRLIAEHLAAGPRVVSAAVPRLRTMAELIDAYHIHVKAYYMSTKEGKGIRCALRPVASLYKDLLIKDFGPLALRAVRQAMIEGDVTSGRSDKNPLAGGGLCRTTVNDHVRRIRRMFRWAEAGELIDAGLYARLTNLEGLRRGHGGREPTPRRPVDVQDVWQVWPCLSRHVWAMVLLQWLTGCRSGELVRLRGVELDRTGEAWTWRPEKHKGEVHGLTRQIAIGPLAQRVLTPWLCTDPRAFLFNPSEADAEHRAALKAEREKRGGAGNNKRRAIRPQRRPGLRYTVDSYRRAIERACQAAGIRVWTPHQLRHSCATRVRSRFGLDAARAVLGHTKPAMTMDYAELDFGKAAQAAVAMG
jgi:integrase